MKRQSVGFIWLMGLLVILTQACLPGALGETEGLSSESQATVTEWQVTELVRGATLHGANGTYIGPDGYLYVASFFGPEIVAFDIDSGEVVHRYGPDDGVLSPDDLTFGPDDSLYWTDLLVGEVGRRTPDGTITKQFVAPGVNPITFSADGRLFVGLCFAGEGLYELDPELILPPRPIVVASEENPFPLGFFNAFDFGPDGRLYGPLFAADMFISIDVDSCHATSDPWSDCDVRVAASGRHIPVAAKFDTQGVLHMLDQWTGELLTLDLETGEQILVAELGQGVDNLAFNAAGRLFVTNADDGSVIEVLADRTVSSLSPGGLIGPGGVAVLERPGGGSSVFVADTFRLWEFDALTGTLLGFEKGLLVGEGLLAPMTLSVDGDWLVISSLFSGPAAQVYDPWFSEVIEHHSMPAPLNALRFQNDLVVADLGHGGVVWASTGEHILSIDEQQVWLPAGLATDGERLWVADWATGMIWQLDFEGRMASELVLIASDLSHPEGLAYDGKNGLLVVEIGAGQLTHIDLGSGEISIIAKGLEIGLSGPTGAPPTAFFSSVTVDATGAIYVTGDIGNVLYRITPHSHLD